MKVISTITEKELHYFYIYGKTLRECLCNKCSDSIGCCGCHGYDVWRMSLNAIPISSKYWDMHKEVREYTAVVLDIVDIETRINELLKKQQDLHDKASELDIIDIETRINELLKKQQDLHDKASELYTKFEVIDE